METVEITNGESATLTRGTPVQVDENGEAVIATTGPVLGLVRNGSVLADATARVVLSGVLAATAAQWDVLTGQSGGLVPGESYYLGQPGKLTTSENGPLLGVALTEYTLLLRIANSTSDAQSAQASTESRVETVEAALAALALWMCETGFDDVPEEILNLLED